MGTCENDVAQSKLDAPMPWIALYIVAASAVCTFFMAADTINGFRQKKLWFPSNYFSLSSTSLTLLSVAMKLPTDLNTFMCSISDSLAKVIGLFFMSTAMGNFSSSLGSMNNKELLSNIVALAILVITVVVNFWIYAIQLTSTIPRYFVYVLIPTSLMLLLLATLVSLAITVPTIKRSMELKYQEMHILALREEEDVINHTIDKEKMMKYWVMAQSSSPQFVMARSVMCTTSNLTCFTAVIILLLTYIDILLYNDHRSLDPPESVYGNFTIWIIVIQSIGVVVGTIAPTFRLFIAITFRLKKSLKHELFKIETYWIQILVDLRDNFSSSQILQHKCRKYLHTAKWLLLNFLIGVQILIVVVSKLLLYVFILLVTPFAHIKYILEMQFSSKVASSSHNHVECDDDTQSNLSRYVLLLEGEPALPKRILKNICRQADNMILIGKRNQPKNLINLLGKFENFSGIIQFDNNNEVPSLHSQEPPNCWMLPLVTLTSIAIGLPNLADYKRRQLVSSVNEGISLVKLIDNTNVELVNINKSAEVSWVGVALYRKWQDVDLMKMSRKCKNSKEMLKDLSRKAERTVMEFKKETKDDFLMENPVNWPVKAIAANSMYRVSQTILLGYKGENEPTDEELFERLCIIIADILMACLTNLASVITTMCHRDAIEKRESSVREAFILLGKTEQIIQILQQHEWPSRDSNGATHINEWCSLFQQDNQSQAESGSTSSHIERPAPYTSTSSLDNVVETSVSNADHSIVILDC